MELTEFSFPKDMPEFCIGCQQCLTGPWDKCPHSNFVDPIYEAIIKAVTRDQVSAYSSTIKEMLPDAMQIADRFPYCIIRRLWIHGTCNGYALYIYAMWSKTSSYCTFFYATKYKMYEVSYGYLKNGGYRKWNKEKKKTKWQSCR